MLSSLAHRGAVAPSLCLALAALAAAPAAAGLVSTQSVGLGANQASVQVDQDDGDSYLFVVHFEAPSITSWDALLAIDSSLDSFAMEFDMFSFGPFLTGITIDGDRDYGTGDLWPVPNYWHFWIDNGAGWESSWTGAQERILTSGGSDAWVFGSDAQPQAIPAPAAGTLALLWLGRSRRARRGVRP